MNEFFLSHVVAIGWSFWIAMFTLTVAISLWLFFTLAKRVFFGMFVRRPK